MEIMSLFLSLVFQFGINVHQKTGAKVLVVWEVIFGERTFVSSTND